MFGDKERVKLKLGDCLDIMPSIPDGSIDFILCDLPYGTTCLEWDVIIPYTSLWKEYNRIIKKNGCIALFGSEPFSSYLRLSNIKNYKYDLYWKKEKPTNFFQLKRRFGKSTENILIFYKSQPTYNPQKYTVDYKVITRPKGKHSSAITGRNKEIYPYNDDGTRYPNDVLEFNRVVLGKTLHPTQKPVALLEYLIKTFTNEGEVVLDNCMGSGSTGEAALNTNRRFFGIEKYPDMYHIAHNRILEILEKRGNDD